MNTCIGSGSGTAARLLLALVLGTGLVATGAAQPAPRPSVEEIVKRLTRPQLGGEELANSAVAIEGQRTRVEQPPSIDLAVTFEFASARLTPDARIVLDNLGQAMRDPALGNARFRIAGHTDARGSDAYNLALSRQRARSVANYLVRQHRIGAQRLSVEGYGRSQLLDPADPEGEVNRRVQVSNLGP